MENKKTDQKRRRKEYWEQWEEQGIIQDISEKLREDFSDAALPSLFGDSVKLKPQSRPEMLRSLKILRSNAGKREKAVELYRMGLLSLDKAAEIAKTTIWEMSELIARREMEAGQEQESE